MGCRTSNRPMATKRNFTVQLANCQYSYLQGQHESFFFFYQIEFGFQFRFKWHRIQFHSTFHLHSHFLNDSATETGKREKKKKKKKKKRVYLIQKHAPQNCVHIHVKVSMALVQLKPRLWIWRVHFCILTQVPNWRKGEVEQVTWELVAAYWETSHTVLIKLLWFWTCHAVHLFLNQLCELSWRTLGP